MVLKLVYIFIGAGVGGVLRYLIGGWVQHMTPGTFPTGTLTVNVVGCLFIGFLGAVFTGPVLIREEYRLAILVGILGGFTTFSTFGSETFSLANDRDFLRAGLNLVLSNGLGLLAVWFGLRMAERWYGV